jgi:hypothetical protein
VRVIWFCISCVALLVATPAPAFAWGYEGHEVIAAIARSYLTPDVKAKADAILATDTADTLTAPDMVSRSTWADAYRNQNRNTAAWHFVDIELDHPDLDAACFNHPSLNGAPASQGPASDCVVDKIDEPQHRASVRWRSSFSYISLATCTNRSTPPTITIAGATASKSRWAASAR